MWSQTGKNCDTRPVEKWRQKCRNVPKNQRKQSTVEFQGALQSNRRPEALQDMQAKSTPKRVSLLPGVRLQKGHLRHVWEENIGHQGLPTKSNVENKPTFLSFISVSLFLKFPVTRRNHISKQFRGQRRLTCPRRLQNFWDRHQHRSNMFWPPDKWLHLVLAAW